ncbi:MAG: ECF transporter S component [Lachnospiraceae bacterium]|nr:ECF transporter S component [Lachnospiraceae bacterium]
MENTKKHNLWLTLCGIIVTLVGILVTILGYQLNQDGEITSQDTVLFIGYFLVMAGILLLLNGLFRLFFKTRTVEYTRSERARRLAFAALFAALSYIGFQYFRFDITVGSEKTAFHLGNTFVMLAALFLGGTWGGLSGAIGLTLADFTSGYVTSAPKTFFLKLCIGLIVGLVAHTIFHINHVQGAKKTTRAALVASICGIAFNIVADPLVGYFYKKYLFGLPQDIATTLAKLSFLTTTVNAVLSVAAAVLLYSALRPALEKSGLSVKGA